VVVPEGVGEHGTDEGPAEGTQAKVYVPYVPPEGVVWPEMLVIPQQTEGFLTWHAIQPAAAATLALVKKYGRPYSYHGAPPVNSATTILFCVIGGNDYHLAYLDLDTSDVVTLISADHGMKQKPLKKDGVTANPKFQTPSQVAKAVASVLLGAEPLKKDVLEEGEEGEGPAPYVLWIAGKAGFAFVDTRAEGGGLYANKENVKLLPNVPTSGAAPGIDLPTDLVDPDSLTEGSLADPDKPDPIAWSASGRVKDEVKVMDKLLAMLADAGKPPVAVAIGSRS